MNTGNIFNSEAQTVVNTINCVGAMGKGIALVYKLRYPKMYELYKDHCRMGTIEIGKLWLYRVENTFPWVLNFPTKYHWRYPSKIEYLERGLSKFCATYREQGIKSIAFPLLGAQNGGLDIDSVKNLMTEYLKNCDIDIEIYEYDAEVADDLFDKFVENWNSLSVEEIKSSTGLGKIRIENITAVLDSGRVKSMIGLINERGIGIKTMEKCFEFVMSEKIIQKRLFD